MEKRIAKKESNFIIPKRNSYKSKPKHVKTTSGPNYTTWPFIWVLINWPEIPREHGPPLRRDIMKWQMLWRAAWQRAPLHAPRWPLTALCHRVDAILTPKLWFLFISLPRQHGVESNQLLTEALIWVVKCNKCTTYMYSPQIYATKKNRNFFIIYFLKWVTCQYNSNTYSI